MTTQTNLTLSPAALSAAVLGIAPESTAGKVLDAALPARPKANRLTSAQSFKLAEWMRGKDRETIATIPAREIAKNAGIELLFRVTGSNADSARRDVLGIRKPAKVKPAVQEHFCVSAATIARIQENYSHLNSDLGMTQRNFENYRAESLKAVEQLRADVRTLALAYLGQDQGTRRMEVIDAVRAIAERNAK